MGTGFIAAFLSAIMNNMPTIMIMDIALQDVDNMHVLAQKGVKIGFWQYSKFGLMITPPVLLLVLLSLAYL